MYYYFKLNRDGWIESRENRSPENEDKTIQAPQVGNCEGQEGSSVWDTVMEERI